MKNRKTVVVAFLLVAVMLMGVGYAAVTNVLDIQGSVTVDSSAAEKEFNEDIYFQGVVVDGQLDADGVIAGDGKGYTANINTNNNDKAQFTVTGIAKTGEEMEITYRIYNDSDHEATVSLRTMTNTNGTIVDAVGTESGAGDFGFDYYFGTTEGTRSATLASKGTVDVTVVVTLKEQLTGQSTASFTIELNVTAG